MNIQKNKLEENIRTNKLLLSKFVDIDLFMDSDIKLKLNETVNLIGTFETCNFIAQKQIDQNIETLSQPEAKVLIDMIKSFNEEVDNLQEMLSKAWVMLNTVCKFDYFIFSQRKRHCYWESKYVRSIGCWYFISL